MRAYFDGIHDVGEDIFGKINGDPFGMIVQMPATIRSRHVDSGRAFLVRENGLDAGSDVVQMRPTEQIS